MEFNYLENIRKLKERIAPFKRQLCNESRCPKIRKRWEDHQHKCHTVKFKKLSLENKEPKSCIKISKYKTADQLVQTSIDMKCHVGTNCNIFHDDKQAMAKIASEVMNAENVGEFFARNQSCNTTVSFKNFYKERLQYEVLQWLREVPIESEFNSTAKIVTEKIVNNLIEKIDKLSVEADEDWYEVKLKREIDHCLNSLPMSYHSTKCAKIRYILTESLITRIMILNSKYLYDAPTSFQDDLDVNHYASSKEIFQVPIVSMFENEIFTWLESKNLKSEDGAPLNLKYITKMLLNRLLPCLMDKSTKRSKYLIKGGIVEVLDTLPLTMALFKNRIFLNGLAMELTNILMNAQNNFEQLTIYNNAYLGFSKTLSYLNPEHYMNNSLRRESIGKPVTLRMSNTSKVRAVGKASSNGIYQSKSNINRPYRESQFVAMELNMSSYSQIERTLTRDPPFSRMTLKILRDVKSRNSIVRLKNFKKNNVPSLLSISLSSVDEKYYNSSCCSYFDKNRNKFRNKNIDRLHGIEDTANVDKVSSLIRAWIEKLPRNYGKLRNRTVMESISGDFAQEITDQMSDPPVGEDSRDKETIGDVISKWLSLLGFVKNSDEALLYKNELLCELQDISLQSPRRLNILQDIEPKMNCKINENMDLLNGEFLSWLSKRPTEISTESDSKKLVHDFAVIIYNELNNKRCNNNLTSILKRWLKNIIESEQNICLQTLSKDFKSQIFQYSRSNQNNKSNVEGCNNGTVFENIMKQCLMTFFSEPNLNKRIAEDVFWNILSNVMQNVYTQYSKMETLQVENEDTPYDKLKTELDYIILISDWFNKLPKTSALHRLSSRQSRMFLINLAKTIENNVSRSELATRLDEDFYRDLILNHCNHFGPLRNACLEKNLTKPLVDALVKYEIQKLKDKQNITTEKDLKKVEKQKEIKNIMKDSQKKYEATDDEMYQELTELVQNEINNMFNYFFSHFNTISTLSYWSVFPVEEWRGCYRPDLAYSILRLLKMTVSIPDYKITFKKLTD
ncbi:PREDICTED: uncharacterized protein LOC106101278 [Papilio polytes]|uniref:uncharacterized protein LOC106101278 n=1 Tax=Papilio polytes TaxID=76194 RepID=UPI00067621F5|nr:PREDICTED: uncharacterized protein LOC106101278 [Papilio polytes]